MDGPLQEDIDDVWQESFDCHRRMCCCRDNNTMLGSFLGCKKKKAEMTSCTMCTSSYMDYFIL
jgi:hypothetical protein